MHDSSEVVSDENGVQDERPSPNLLKEYRVQNHPYDGDDVASGTDDDADGHFVNRGLALVSTRPVHNLDSDVDVTNSENGHDEGRDGSGNVNGDESAPVHRDAYHIARDFNCENQDDDNRCWPLVR